jgi:uncharacterized protein YpuA (DUF1002 family)
VSVNGPEHYGEAERLVAGTQRMLGDASENTYADALATAAVHVAQAQVHATLALTAAAALPTIAEWFESEDDVTAWARTVKSETFPDAATS